MYRYRLSGFSYRRVIMRWCYNVSVRSKKLTEVVRGENSQVSLPNGIAAWNLVQFRSSVSASSSVIHKRTVALNCGISVGSWML
jgi:hypothetical protein